MGTTYKSSNRLNIQVDIDAYVRGDLTAQELTERVNSLVMVKPEIYHEVIDQLDANYRKQQIPLDLFVSLVDSVRTASIPGAIKTASSSVIGTVGRSVGNLSAPPATDPLSGTEEDVTNINTGGPLPAGAVIRDRFTIESVLGVGGMGIVYKVLDSVRAEARDRYPRVALKVLNADFNEHPKAFMALQRECSRTQRLAHPNIATVYDFDRTEDTVFMTMELLEGMPLDRHIKRVIPKRGLPFETALPIIEDLGKALSYAHQHGIVHSDFKPANAFITKEGSVKILDFGIARATKQPGQEETTIFDGSDIGALTPAYASPEMHDGLDSDPRDDVYALACVAYELLSGRHPFDKQPANKARALDLAPDPISGQPKGAMRALCHGLEFERDLRCASVDTFLDELRKKNRFSGKVIFGATTALAASALLGAGWWWFYSGDVTGPPEGDRVVVDRPGEARGQAPEAADIQPRPIQDKPPKHDNLALSNLDKEQLTGESLKRENLEHQFIETERTGKERLDQQHSTHELLERNRIERERIEKEILRRQRLEQERIETARIEQKRLEQERLEQKRIETARIEQERLEQKRIETARIERERLEQARIEAARVEQERLEQQRIDNERLALEAEKKRLVEEKARLKEAEERLKAQRRAERAAREKSRVKEIARLQNKLLEQAKQQKVEQAEKLLIILEDKAPPNDRFVRETAPSTIANAYHRLSRASALKGEYAQAIKFSSRGLELKPTNQELKVDHSIYQAILRLEGLPSRIKGGELDLSTKENRLAVKLLTEKRPGQLQKYTQGIIDAVKQRIVQLDEQDSALAHTLLRSARGLLPNDQRLDQVAIMEPVHIAIVTQVVSVLGSGMTEKQYARKVGQVVASRLGIIMGRGKLMVRLLAGSKWARPVRQEGGAHNVSRGICVKQKVFHILTVVLRAETDNFDDNGFSDPTVEFTLYDCKTDRKITKSFSIGTNSKDEFRYETDLLATLVRFVEQNPFLGAEISR